MLLKQIRDRLVGRIPRQLPCDFPLEDLGAVRDAAVLLAIIDSADPELVLIKRADSTGNHGGQVALPGGMWEEGDSDLAQTALRESAEEIALPRTHVDIVASLDSRITRFGVRVSPFVGVIPPGLTFVPELAELDAVFQVPLRHLLNLDNYGIARFDTVAGVFDAPCIAFERYQIWGVTYGIIQDMLAEVYDFDAGFDRKSVAVEDL